MGPKNYKVHFLSLWVCWFLGKNHSNFVSPVWKLHNPCILPYSKALIIKQFSKYRYIFLFLQFTVGQQLSCLSTMELPETCQVQICSQVLHRCGCTYNLMKPSPSAFWYKWLIICHKFLKKFPWLKLQHSNWRANLVKEFFDK